MAQKLKEFQFAKRGKYPWLEWANGDTWKAEQGTDFDISPEGFRSILYQRAGYEGCRVETSVISETEIVFRFFDA